MTVVPKVRALQDKFWGLPVPDHLVHSVNNMSRKVYGCDCSLCLPSGRPGKAHGTGTPHKERQRAYRGRKWGTPVPPHVKHGVATQRTYGCKCTICRAAKTEQRHKDRWRWMETARGRYDFQGDTRFGKTIICWPPKGAGPDWRCPECGR